MPRPKGLPKTGGRRKGVGNRVGRDVRELARQYTDESIDALVRIMRNDRHPNQGQAADKLLDRGWGKPAQSLQHTGAEGGPIIFSWADES